MAEPFPGISLGSIEEPATRKALDTLMRHLSSQKEAPSVSRLAAQWSSSVALTNLSATYVDIYSAAGSSGLPVSVDFSDAKQVAIEVQWARAGLDTGVHDLRVVNAEGIEDILGTIPGLQTGASSLPFLKLPLWARDRTRKIKLQARSSVITDDPTFHSCIIRVK